MGLADFVENPKPPRIETATPHVPKGWERSFESNGPDVLITTGPLTVEASPQLWADLLADWGLDPDTVELVGDPKVKGWDSPVKGTTTGETIRLRSYSVRFRNKAKAIGTVDVARLLKSAAKRKPSRKQPVPADDAERALLVLLADWQVGKGEGGGSAGTVERITAAFDATLDRLAELAKVGRPCHVVYVVGMGDLVEGCTGHYASQQSTVDLDLRQQTMVVMRLIVNIVDRLVDAGYRVVLSGVAGNHGENRAGGSKAITGPEDNVDLMVIEQAGEVFKGNPERYANVTVWIPDALSMSLDICGVIVGFYHGHMGSMKANPLTKLATWWTNQIVDGGPTAPARILVTGHYHHLHISEGGGGSRTHIQCPAMDGGSRWFRESAGKSSPPGFLTLVVGESCGPRGYDDLKVA